jgi:hypothetical protein
MSDVVHGLVEEHVCRSVCCESHAGVDVAHDPVVQSV